MTIYHPSERANLIGIFSNITDSIHKLSQFMFTEIPKKMMYPN